MSQLPSPSKLTLLKGRKYTVSTSHTSQLPRELGIQQVLSKCLFHRVYLFIKDRAVTQSVDFLNQFILILLEILSRILL